MAQIISAEFASSDIVLSFSFRPFVSRVLRPPFRISSLTHTPTLVHTSTTRFGETQRSEALTALVEIFTPATSTRGDTLLHPV